MKDIAIGLERYGVTINNIMTVLDDSYVVNFPVSDTETPIQEVCDKIGNYLFMASTKRTEIYGYMFKGNVIVVDGLWKNGEWQPGRYAYVGFTLDNHLKVQRYRKVALMKDIELILSSIFKSVEEITGGDYTMTLGASRHGEGYSLPSIDGSIIYEEGKWAAGYYTAHIFSD